MNTFKRQVPDFAIYKITFKISITNNDFKIIWTPKEEYYKIIGNDPSSPNSNTFLITKKYHNKRLILLEEAIKIFKENILVDEVEFRK